MAWARGLPTGTQESTPIVYRGVMYLFAPGATIQAVDATNGDLIWEYKRELSARAFPDARRANKSLGIYEDMIYFAAPDGFLVAIDAQTGKQRWETKVDNGGQTGGRHSRRRRQGDHQPHLRAGRSARTASSPRTTPRPARKSGTSTPPPRPASPAAIPGPTCRPTSAPPVRGVCRLLRSQAQDRSTGASPIRTPIRG